MCSGMLDLIRDSRTSGCGQIVPGWASAFSFQNLPAPGARPWLGVGHGQNALVTPSPKDGASAAAIRTSPAGREARPVIVWNWPDVERSSRATSRL